MPYLPMELDLSGSLEHVKRLSDECRPDVERFRLSVWTRDAGIEPSWSDVVSRGLYPLPGAAGRSAPSP